MSPDSTPAELSTDPILGSYWAVALIALGLIALLALGPRYGRLSWPRKAVLTVLRLLIIGLVVIALLRPTKLTTVKTPRSSVVIVMVDTSRSMLLPNGKDEMTRWQALQKTIDKVKSQLVNPGPDLELRTYTYDSRLHPWQIVNGQLQLPEKPTGEQTDVGTSLYQALLPEQGKRLAAVVLLGDGAQTAFDPQIEVQEAGRKIRDDFAAPLFTVTFGPSGDAAQSRDVAVERLDEQFTVFVKNEVVVKGQIRVRGYAQKKIPVELFLEDASGNRQSLGKKDIVATDDIKPIEVDFPITPEKVGHFRLTMQAALQDGELVAKNNALSAYLTVLEGGLRILFLDGEKRFEQKFLRRAINASPDIDLDDRILDIRGKKNWPINLSEDLKRDKYDAYILGEVDAAALGPQQMQQLASNVAAGKGLLMIGGRGSFGWGHYRGTPIEQLLPIRFNAIEGSDGLNESQLSRFFLEGPVTMVPQQHPITRLAGDTQNAALWKKIPPLAWAHKFNGLKNGPGIRVLIESPAGDPLLVSGEYGRGRVLAFAGESTYRWPMHGFEQEHKRFWRQIVLWLVRRDDLDRDDVWIKLDQRRFNPGSRVQITAGARSSTGDAITTATLDTQLVLPGGQKQPIRLSLDGEQYVGSVEVKTPGDYAVELTATRENRKLGNARAEFLVFDRDIELSNPAADPAQMAALADWTKDDGGGALAPEQLSAQIDAIRNRKKEYEIRQTKWQLASTSGDAWLFFCLLVGLLGTDWFLRKKWGLV
ncbi:glutamine amidotransferase [Anatilimnocola floriformis]|uniref:glutamine amidotransferase n=1 Tax=Anatilimnocola floriformis TaxID=2948575 RepID=UPI0020C22070|nr:glutamine amidotransferase [Anatilimnocola floriformis]